MKAPTVGAEKTATIGGPAQSSLGLRILRILRTELLRSRHILSSIGVLSLGTIGSQGLTAAAGIVLARRGGSTEFGVLTAGLGVVALTSDITSLGTGTYIARELAAGRWTPAQSLAAVRWRSAVCICLVLAVDAGMVISGPKRLSLYLILSAYCLFFNANVTLAALVRARGLYTRSAAAGIAERLTLVVMVGGVALARASILLGFAVGLLLGSMVSTSMNVLVLRGQLAAGEPIRGRSPLSVGRLYRVSFSLGISGLATDLSVLESPLVSVGAGAGATGLYGAASKIVSPLLIPAAAAASVLFRTLGSRSGDLVEVVRVLRRFSLILVPYTLILTFIFLMARPLVSLLLGAAYLPVTATILRIMCVTTLCSVMSQLIFVALISANQERVVARCLWVTVPLGLALTLLGARFGGPERAALGGLCAELLAIVWQGGALRSSLRAAPDRSADAASPQIGGFIRRSLRTFGR